MGYRQQWGDVPGNPKTIYLTAYAPLSKPSESQYMRASMRLNGRVQTSDFNTSSKPGISHIVGTIITNDDFGLFNKTTVHFSYGIHLPLANNLSISAAPKIGMVNLNLNNGLWVLEDEDTPFQSFLGSYSSETMFDIGFGIWLYSDRFFLGYSLEQLSSNNLEQLDQASGYEFIPHHFFSLGYAFQINPYFRLVPGAMVRYLSTSPLNIDYSIRLEYKNQVWLGMSLRKENALVGMLGLFVNSNIKFNYTYDHGMASGGRDGLNAHEISLKISAFQNLYKK